jgi:hypothetical protein
MNAHRVTIDWRGFLNHLAGNVGVVVVVAAAVVAALIFLQPTPDPVFVCHKGKHWDMRYVGEVATLGCFE